jgi:hypothetical protein
MLALRIALSIEGVGEPTRMCVTETRGRSKWRLVGTIEKYLPVAAGVTDRSPLWRIQEKIRLKRYAFMIGDEPRRYFGEQGDTSIKELDLKAGTSSTGWET